MREPLRRTKRIAKRKSGINRTCCRENRRAVARMTQFQRQSKRKHETKLSKRKHERHRQSKRKHETKQSTDLMESGESMGREEDDLPNQARA